MQFVVICAVSRPNFPTRGKVCLRERHKKFFVFWYPSSLTGVPFPVAPANSSWLAVKSQGNYLWASLWKSEPKFLTSFYTKKVLQNLAHLKFFFQDDLSWEVERNLASRRRNSCNRLEL